MVNDDELKLTMSKEQLLRSYFYINIYTHTSCHFHIDVDIHVGI